MKIKTTKDYLIEGKMLLKGTIIDIIEESKFIEMADIWNNIKDELTDERAIREEHLIKLFYYKGQNHYNDNFKGWVASARKGFEHISKLKNNNKYPSDDKIYDAIWLTVKESFDDFHKGVIEDLNESYADFEIITDIKYDEVRNFVEEFNKWASEQLSKKGNINMTETATKIKELLGI